MGATRKGWFERKEIQKVTQEWVRINCRLTDREKELLKIIHERKLVRRDHLEIISESYRNLGNWRSKAVNRAINKMFQKMILDKTHEIQDIGKGNSPSIVALDKGGSIILGVPHKKRILHHNTIYKGKQYIMRSLPSNYKHINGINKLEVETILFCDSTENEILRWEHEVATTFMYNEEEILFIPDIFFELRLKNDKRFLGFIEFDTGSENHRNKNDFPIIYNKLINYRRYKVSELWVDDYKYFPLIMLVTEDDKRIPYFRKKCQELGLQGLGVYYESYTKVLWRLANMV